MENVHSESENLFDILVATDIHLGYAEKDSTRGEDSFVTFEEILSLAAEKKVDFVLLGGDLFHDNKPSQRCLHSCITLLRRYCMGDNPVKFEFLSDQSTNFGHCPFPNVNYEDPNLNIALPVFSIHGNHDDPTGNWHLGTLDLLSATGLVNYFGHNPSLKQVEVRPLLLRKGSTLLALFGLGAIKDERLSRLLSCSKVEIFRPKVNVDDWFNLMVVHQNHVMRGTSQKSFIPESALPSFMDLIIWGHEHQCIPDPEWNPTKEFFVLQPGSSVATSLSEGEAAPKNVFHLQVRGRHFRVTPIPLTTVRPFVFDTLRLSLFDSLQPKDDDYNLKKKKKNEPTLSKMVEDQVTEKIETMLLEAVSQRTGNPKQPKLPLIRLRIEYTHQEQMINTVRVGLNYMDQVANPNDMLLQKRQAIKGGKIKEEMESLDEAALFDAAERAREQQDAIGELRVETVVEQYFQTNSMDMDDSIDRKTKQLKVLSVRALIEGVTRYVDKQENDSISEVYQHQVGKTVEHLKTEDVPGDEDSIYEGLQNFQLLRERNKVKEEEEMVNHLNSRKKAAKGSGKTAPPTTIQASDDDEMDEDVEEDFPPQRGRGRGAARSRGRASNARQGKTAPPTTIQASVDDEMDEDVEEDFPPQRGRGRGAARSRGRASNARQRGGRSTNYDEDDDYNQDIPPAKGRGASRSRARGRGARGRAAAQPQLSFAKNSSIDSFMTCSKTPSRTRTSYISSSDED